MLLCWASIFIMIVIVFSWWCGNKFEWADHVLQCTVLCHFKITWIIPQHSHFTLSAGAWRREVRRTGVPHATPAIPEGLLGHATWRLALPPVSAPPINAAWGWHRRAFPTEVSRCSWLPWKESRETGRGQKGTKTTGGSPGSPTNDPLPAAPLPSASFIRAPKAAGFGKLFLKPLFCCHLTRFTDADVETHS